MSVTSGSKETARQEVITWLKLIYGDQFSPSFEDNYENYVILKELSKSALGSQKISNMYLQDLVSKTEEYEERAEKMRLCFESSYLSPSCLENSAQSTLRYLASCACMLNLKDLNDTSYLMAMTQLKKDQLVLDRDRKKEELLHKKLSDSILALMLRTELLETKLALIGDQPQTVKCDLEKKEQEQCFLNKKSVNYERQISLSAEQLKSVGLESTILHNTLVKQSQKLREMEKKCDILSQKLGRFQGLPANRDLAIAEVEKLKEEIRGLDQKLVTAANKNQN